MVSSVCLCREAAGPLGRNASSPGRAPPCTASPDTRCGGHRYRDGNPEGKGAVPYRGWETEAELTRTPSVHRLLYFSIIFPFRALLSHRSPGLRAGVYWAATTSQRCEGQHSEAVEERVCPLWGLRAVRVGRRSSTWAGAAVAEGSTEASAVFTRSEESAPQKLGVTDACRKCGVHRQG